MGFRVRLIFAVTSAVCSSSAVADDIGAAARGVVRVIAITKGSADEENSSVSFGSGFAISPHHIVTNAHVVEDARNAYADSVVAIVPSEGSRAQVGTIVAYDRTHDLAIIDVGSIRLEPLAIYSGPTSSGEHTAALGYPGNVDRATINSIYDLITPTSPVRTEGTISAERRVDGTSALLHTAAISRGNSGGPLVDECGRVLGVNTYTANSESGDAPFGFAIVSQEVMSFLRDNDEQFQQIGLACVTMAEQTRREQLAQEGAARTEAADQKRMADEKQRSIDAQIMDLKDSRADHVASAALLAVLALIAGAFATALFIKDRVKGAGAAGLVAALGLIGGAYAFFSRPGLKVEATKLTAQATAASLKGKILCRIKPELSRVTVSSTNDLPLSWDSTGCMNGRTQYVQSGSDWTRVLVPNGSETVSVQSFDPAKGEYVSTRYLLAQSDMERLRAIRGGASTTNSCTSDTATSSQLQAVTDQLASALPATPNEKLVYECAQVGD